MEKEIAYIFGAILNDPDHKEKFARAEQKLRAEGYIVLNPTVLPQELPYGKCFPPCFGMIDVCDVMYGLTTWVISDGARREYFYGHSKQKKFRFEANEK